MHFGQNRSYPLFRAVLLTTLAVIPLVAGLVPAGAAPMGAGSVSGHVVDEQGNAIAGICVDIENGPGTQTAIDGSYTVAGVSPGSVKVGFRDCNPTPRFVTQWYLKYSDANSADSVGVVDGTDTPLSTVTMIAGVTIAGTVKDVSGTALPGITVSVSATEPNQASTSTSTDPSGNYTTVPLAAGGYKVQFLDQSGTPVYAPQYWNKQSSWNTADLLKLQPTDGPTRSGIDGALTVASTIQGTVRAADGTPLEGICIDANVLTSGGGYDWVTGSSTGADGTYTISQLPAADIRIRFHECHDGLYLEQWYDGKQNADDSTPIVLASGDTRTGVDANMQTGIGVSGIVRDDHGNPLPNISVNVNPTDEGPSVGTRTDVDGSYTTSALPSGSYRVQFRDDAPTPVWAAQYWKNQPSYHGATILQLSSGDGPLVHDINATLTRGASVKGTVTSSTGPVGGICVSAETDSDGGDTDWISGDTTSPDGTYKLSGLPATDVKVHFQDCSSVGPYIEQWWNNKTSAEDATAISLTSGNTRSNVNAVLVAAGQISGTVTDANGHPLRGICAQATTDTFVGGISGTDDDGHYAIDLARPGRYRVQFIACGDDRRYAGEWWDNQKTAATARMIDVGAGEVVRHIDASLARGATSTISGKVTNINGAAMTSACVIAFVPDKFALFGMVQPDGTYAIPDVPSGTYALAFLGCTGGEPQPTLIDPQVPTVSYPGVWWKNALVNIDEGSPDPIDQGATLIAVKPGEHLKGYDMCFGCNAITITKITPGDGSLTVEFETSGLLPAGVQSMAVNPAASGYTYTVTCTSATGVTGTATGTSSPITVTGLTPGADYTCRRHRIGWFGDRRRVRRVGRGAIDAGARDRVAQR